MTAHLCTHVPIIRALCTQCLQASRATSHTASLKPNKLPWMFYVALSSAAPCARPLFSPTRVVCLPPFSQLVFTNPFPSCLTILSLVTAPPSRCRAVVCFSIMLRSWFTACHVSCLKVGCRRFRRRRKKQEIYLSIILDRGGFHNINPIITLVDKNRSTARWGFN